MASEVWTKRCGTDTHRGPPGQKEPDHVICEKVSARENTVQVTRARLGRVASLPSTARRGATHVPSRHRPPLPLRSLRSGATEDAPAEVFPQTRLSLLGLPGTP